MYTTCWHITASTKGLRDDDEPCHIDLCMDTWAAVLHELGQGKGAQGVCMCVGESMPEGDWYGWVITKDVAKMHGMCLFHLQKCLIWCPFLDIFGQQLQHAEIWRWQCYHWCSQQMRQFPSDALPEMSAQSLPYSKRTFRLLDATQKIHSVITRPEGPLSHRGPRGLQKRK